MGFENINRARTEKSVERADKHVEKTAGQEESLGHLIQRQQLALMVDKLRKIESGEQ